MSSVPLDNLYTEWLTSTIFEALDEETDEEGCLHTSEVNF